MANHSDSNYRRIKKLHFTIFSEWGMKNKLKKKDILSNISHIPLQVVHFTTEMF